jgi:hypothetical protein
MIHLRFFFKVLLLGLSIAQVLATVRVYLSNLHYHTFLTSVQKAGYLAVPNQQVFENLGDLGPAFFGALFFTLTAGASLTVMAFGLAWAWVHLFSHNRFILLLFIALLLLCLVSANRHAFSPLITGHLLLIPALVFFFTLKWLPEEPEERRLSHVLYPVIPFAVIAMTLILLKPSTRNMDPFLTIRDSLLLSNPIGRKANDFYYENSLYATRVFESPRQQLIRGCRLEGVSDPLLHRRITRVLLSRDVLPLTDMDRPGLRISLSENDLVFHKRSKPVLTCSTRDFFHNPGATLNRVDERTARHTFLLGFILFSLFFLGALLLFVCTYVPIFFLSGLFLKSTPRAIKAGILWPVAFLLLFLVFRPSDSQSLSNPDDLAEAMKADRLCSRIAALKHIYRNKIDIAGFPPYESMLRSLHIPERYWLAKALGVSRTPETRKSIRQLLDDPHFNVVSMALEALGKRGERADIALILAKIEVSDSWYEQWYGYRAIRRLGWSQRKSRQEKSMGATVGSHALSGHQFGQ